jgi:hypothetical protein
MSAEAEQQRPPSPHHEDVSSSAGHDLQQPPAPRSVHFRILNPGNSSSDFLEAGTPSDIPSPLIPLRLDLGCLCIGDNFFNGDLTVPGKTFADRLSRHTRRRIKAVSFIPGNTTTAEQASDIMRRDLVVARLYREGIAVKQVIVSLGGADLESLSRTGASCAETTRAGLLDRIATAIAQTIRYTREQCVNTAQLPPQFYVCSVPPRGPKSPSWQLWQSMRNGLNARLRAVSLRENCVFIDTSEPLLIQDTDMLRNVFHDGDGYHLNDHAVDSIAKGVARIVTQHDTSYSASCMPVCVAM